MFTSSYLLQINGCTLSLIAVTMLGVCCFASADCVPIGQAANADDLCCSKSRSNGICVCGPNGLWLPANELCCSGFRHEGICACVPEGHKASDAVQCCSGAFGHHPPGVCSCLPVGTAADNAASCCAGFRHNGVCGGAMGGTGRPLLAHKPTPKP